MSGEPIDPLFVAGVSQRSGTNYLARALVLHPALVRPTGHWELPLLDVSDDFRAATAAFVGRRAEGRLRFDFATIAGGIGEALLGELWSRVDEPAGARTLVLKNPSTRGIDDFELFFPRGRLVLLTRDCRDVVNSQMAAIKGSSRRLAHMPRMVRLAFFARHWRDAARRVLEGSRGLIVRYEDLVSSPDEVLGKICPLVGVDASDEWLQSVADLSVRGSTHHGRPGGVGGQPVYDEVEVSEDFRPFGRWRAEWSAAERSLVSRIAGSEMRALGYDTDD